MNPPRQTLWACPRCAQEVRALATEVSHRCPCVRQNAWVMWERVAEVRELVRMLVTG